jgi:hypothetical protein
MPHRIEAGVVLLRRWLALAVVLGVASGCGSDGKPERERATRVDTAGGVRWSPPRHVACAPSQERSELFCGIAPPAARTDGGSVVRVMTVTGEAFWILLPNKRARVVALQGVPVRIDGLASTPIPGLTTANPRRAADRYCADFPACEPIVIERELAPNDAVVLRWDDASGTLRDLAVTTARFGPWTLVLRGHMEPAKRIARSLEWQAGRNGFLRVSVTEAGVVLDEDWADVLLRVAPAGQQTSYGLQITPGCHLTSKEPDLGGDDVGPELERFPPDAGAVGAGARTGTGWMPSRTTTERWSDFTRHSE